MNDLYIASSVGYRSDRFDISFDKKNKMIEPKKVRYLDNVFDNSINDNDTITP